MSKYIRQIKVEVDFDGDKGIAVLRPLTLSEVMRLMPYTKGKAQDDYSRREQEAKLIETFGDMLPSILVSISGLTDADGQPITAAELRDAYFAPVLAQLAVSAIAAAAPPNPPQPASQPGG